MDFGLAKNVTTSKKLTKTGDIVGTPQYMAPEQTQGRKGTVGPFTDVYALGAILYEMLTGVPVVTGETLYNIMFNIVTKDIIPPSKHNPRLAHEIELICMKALEKDPQRRYANAQEFEQDIKRYLDGEAIIARSPSPGYILRKKLVKNKKLLAVVLLVALVFYRHTGGNVSAEPG